MFRTIFEALELRAETPNKFTVFLGERLKEAREAKGISQAELADMVYKRRPSISDMENGRMMPDIATMFFIARALDKPLEYFIHPVIMRKFPSDVSEVEQEMLIQFRKLSPEGQRLAIHQIGALAEYLADKDLVDY